MITKKKDPPRAANRRLFTLFLVAATLLGVAVGYGVLAATAGFEIVSDGEVLSLKAAGED